MSTALRTLFIIISLLTFFRQSPLHAADQVPAREKALLNKYHEIEKRLFKNQFGVPVYIESYDGNNTIRVDIYGIFDYPFDHMRNILQVPANWCDIALLHINIKSCTYHTLNGDTLLTFYSGRKYYQAPDEAYQLKYRYHLFAPQPEYLNISLAADEGPLHTKDHRLRLEAIPIEKGSTFVHFSYAYSYGLLGEITMKSYFATIGRDKVGFSIIDTDNQGNPVYIGGVRGAIERNAVRYYLAIQAHFDMVHTQEEQRFERRLSRWYDLTDRYRLQLFEVEKEEYLKNKKRERQNQLMLQKEPTP